MPITEMQPVAAWFERSFDTPFPTALLPNLLTRLRGTPARMEELLGHSPPELWRVNPPGQWSAQEHAGHLADLEPLWLARVDDYAGECEALTPADLSNRKTAAANHNVRHLHEILAEFRTARARLVSRVNDMSVARFGHALPHPRLGTPMRLADHLHFVAEHDDHHLAQIWRLLRRGDAGAPLPPWTPTRSTAGEPTP